LGLRLRSEKLVICVHADPQAMTCRALDDGAQVAGALRVEGCAYRNLVRGIS
jgi:hypothetical protein